MAKFANQISIGSDGCLEFAVCAKLRRDGAELAHVTIGSLVDDFDVTASTLLGALQSQMVSSDLGGKSFLSDVFCAQVRIDEYGVFHVSRLSNVAEFRTRRLLALGSLGQADVVILQLRVHANASLFHRHGSVQIADIAR